MSAVITLVRARRIRTMGGPGAPSVVDALAVLGERVIGAGDLDDLRARFPRHTVVDLGSAAVVPGFNDAHCHLTMAARNTQGVDLADVPDRATLEEVLRSATRRTGGWVTASRYDHMRSTGGQVLDRAALDALAPDHPLLVVHVGAHWGVANSAALTAAGLDDDSPDPAGGALGRDPAGRLDGRLYEQALFDFVYPSLATGPTVVPPPDPDTMVAAIERTATSFLAAGITSLGDAMVGPDDLRLLQRARREGRLPLRVNALLTHPHLDHLAGTGIEDGFGDRWLRVGGVKAFVDGAVAGRNCWVSEPFVGTDDHGMAVIDAAELHDLARRVHRAGLRLAVHANGDLAIGTLLDAVAAARTERPDIDTWHRIEHCSIVDDDLLTRIRDLRMVPVPFASYVHVHGDALLEWYGQERIGRMFAHRRMLDVGIPVAGSSDYPCAPYEPLLGVQSCVTRRSRTGQELGPHQRLDVADALRLFGTGSAFTTGEHTEKGRLVAGYLADFVALERDPGEVAPDEIAQIPVLETWVGGARAWSVTEPPTPHQPDTATGRQQR